MNILFVDKDKNSNEVLYPLLAKKNNANYKIATTSREAIQILKTDFVPDFIFIEYDVPPGNGMDVVLYIQTKPYKDKVHILMTTDLADYEKIEQLADNLGIDFERKPLQLYSLQKYISENWKIG